MRLSQIRIRGYKILKNPYPYPNGYLNPARTIITIGKIALWAPRPTGSWRTVGRRPTPARGWGFYVSWVLVGFGWGAARENIARGCINNTPSIVLCLLQIYWRYIDGLYRLPHQSGAPPVSEHCLIAKHIFSDPNAAAFSKTDQRVDSTLCPAGSCTTIKKVAYILAKISSATWSNKWKISRKWTKGNIVQLRKSSLHETNVINV